MIQVGNNKQTHPLPTKTRVSIAAEALVTLTEIRPDDVTAPSVGVTRVTTRYTLILI